MYFSKENLFDIIASLAIRQSPNSETVADDIGKAFFDNDLRYSIIYNIHKKDMKKLLAGKVVISNSMANMTNESFSFYCKVPNESELSTWIIPFSGEHFITKDWCKFALPQLVSRHQKYLDVNEFIDKDKLHICLDE